MWFTSVWATLKTTYWTKSSDTDIVISYEWAHDSTAEGLTWVFFVNLCCLKLHSLWPHLRRDYNLLELPTPFIQGRDDSILISHKIEEVSLHWTMKYVLCVQKDLCTEFFTVICWNTPTISWISLRPFTVWMGCDQSALLNCETNRNPSSILDCTTSNTTWLRVHLRFLGMQTETLTIKMHCDLLRLQCTL